MLKTCGGSDSGAMEDLEVQEPQPFSQTFGEQKFSTGTNEGRSISRFIVKKGSCNEIKKSGKGQS